MRAAPVREHANLGWPDTPFGASRRPFPRHVRLIAATAVTWAGVGDRAVPAAAGLVYLPVLRAGAMHVRAETLHVGYRVAVLDHPAESPEIVDLIDGHLVQGRRHAAALAVWRWPDDAVGLQAWASGDTPGITAVSAAWAARPVAERGTAPVIETSGRPGGSASLPAVGARQGLDIPEGPGGLLSQPEIQAACRRLFPEEGPGARPDDQDGAASALGLSALCQGLATALLAAAEGGSFSWDSPLGTAQVLANVAWDAFPENLPASAPSAVLRRLASPRDR
jgi:hypothetical protein